MMPSTRVSVKSDRPKRPGSRHLAEDHILLWSRQRLPRAHPPLQRATHVGIDLGMAPADLVDHGDGPDAGRGLQDRHDLRVPDADEGIGRPPAARLLRLLDPVAGCRAELCLGGSSDGGVGWSDTHVQPHLVVEAGQALISQSLRQISSLAPSWRPLSVDGLGSTPLGLGSGNDLSSA
jgi:hypothetical protein